MPEQWTARAIIEAPTVLIEQDFGFLIDNVALLGWTFSDDLARNDSWEVVHPGLRVRFVHRQLFGGSWKRAYAAGVIEYNDDGNWRPAIVFVFCGKYGDQTKIRVVEAGRAMRVFDALQELEIQRMPPIDSDLLNLEDDMGVRS